MWVIRIPGIVQTAIFVGLCPNPMFPYTCSTTRSCKIDHLLLADDLAQHVFEAFYPSERVDNIEIYPLVSNTLLITVQPSTAYSIPHTIPYSLRLFLCVTRIRHRHSCRSSAGAASACGFDCYKVASWTLGCLWLPLRQKTKIS